MQESEVIVFGNFGNRNNKFGARKATFMGIEFDSSYERDRYIYLRDRLRKGEIEGLRLQVRFEIIPKSTKLVAKQLKTKVKYIECVIEQSADYTCDFIYKENGVYVMEEFKSEMTAKLQDYVLRRKLMIHKIYEHNRKGRGQWVFREVVYSGRNLKITDK